MRRGRQVRRVASIAATCALGVVVLGASVGAVPGASRPTRLPLPKPWGNAPVAHYQSIACRVVGACTTIGTRSLAPDNHLAAAAAQRMGSWGAQSEVVLPSGASGGTFYSIACPTQGNCLAVGTWTATTGGEAIQPMIARESSNVWGAGTPSIPLPAGTTTSELRGISCPSARSCVVVGTAATNHNAVFHAFIDQMVGGVWHASVVLPDPKSSRLAHLRRVLPYGISCPGAGSCVVVGDILGHSSGLAFTEVEHAGTWTSRVIVPSGATLSILNSVDCTSPTRCIAVGETAPSSSGGFAPLSVTFASGRWSSGLVLQWRFLAPSTSGGVLFGVSCSSPARCVAVGQLAGSPHSAYGDIPVAYTWDNGRWSPPAIAEAPIVQGSRSKYAVLLAISCSASGCETVGSASPSSGGAGLYPFSTTVQPINAGSPPGAPSAITVAATHGSFDVTWHGPTSFGGSPIATYLVVATSKGEPATSCVTESLSCTLSGIAPKHSYAVEVTATNAAHRRGPPARRTATGA